MADLQSSPSPALERWRSQTGGDPHLTVQVLHNPAIMLDGFHLLAAHQQRPPPISITPAKSKSQPWLLPSLIPIIDTLNSKNKTEWRKIWDYMLAALPPAVTINNTTDSPKLRRPNPIL